MARKKLSDMTIYEKVERILTGVSNEEAEEVAVKILAQLIAKHAYIENDLDAYNKGLWKKLTEAAIKFSQSHSLEMALAKAVHDKEKELKEN